MTFQLAKESPTLITEMVARESGVLFSRLVGFDDVEDRHYSVVVTLDLMPGLDYELSFFLEEFDTTNDSVFQYWRATDVVGFIPPPERKVILAIVLRLVTAAVQQVMPERIYMCSRGDSRSEREEMKYSLIALAIEMCGYRVRKPDRYHDQRIWWMDREVIEAASIGR